MKSSVNRSVAVTSLSSFALGWLSLYFLDSSQRKRRISHLKGAVIHLYHRSEDLLDKAGRDLMNRGRGLRARSYIPRLSSVPVLDDEKLKARVRSKLGRCVSHPHAIDVTVQHGVVLLKGSLLAAELPPFLAKLHRMPEIAEVINQLEVFETAGSTPELQGGRPRIGSPIDFLQTRWAPSTRLLVGTAGLLACGYGMQKKKPLGSTVFTAGALSVFRAFTNVPPQQWIGLGRQKRGVRIKKTMNIEGVVDRVFDFWTNVSQFPKFMADVKEIHITREIQSHWNIVGPAGTSITWDALTTKKIPNKLIEWKTLPGSMISHYGQIQFRPNEQGGTRIDFDLTYFPPAGALGNLIAQVVGADPKHKIEKALFQIKTLMEQGPSERQLRSIAS